MKKKKVWPEEEILRMERDLSRLVPGGVTVGEPMARHTTWRVGGKADLFVRPTTVDEVREVICYVHSRGLPLHVIGNGSNLLVLDGGLRGVTMQLKDNFQGIKVRRPYITALAGTLLTQVAKRAAASGLTGLEFAAGIPATVGGAVVMNAGAFGSSVSERLHRVRVIRFDGQDIVFHREQLENRYRRNPLPDKGVVVEAVFLLTPGDKEEIYRTMERYNEERRRKQPLQWPNAGSVFKNPPGATAGELIEKAGLKGYTIGGAQISEQHANFIINTGNATAADIVLLIRTVQRRVAEKFGIVLEPEVKIIGEP